MTVREFWERWGELFPRPDPLTTRRAVSGAKPFVEKFGRRPLPQLDGLRVIAWAQRNPRHARYVRSMLADAVRARELDFNPLEGVSIPSPPTAEHYQPDESEVWRLAEVAGELHGELFGTMVLAAAFTGARLGQLRCLEVEHVRIPSAPLRVRVRAQKGNPAREVAVLRPGRERLAEAVLGRRGPVFLFGKRPWSASAHSAAWIEVREASGLPVRFHSLRGFCATYMVDRGVQPIDLARQLHGSNDPRTVMAYYARPSHEAALDRIEALGV